MTRSRLGKQKLLERLVEKRPQISRSARKFDN